MYLFIKFVHIISAMVFFGLPFAFGRWFHATTLTHDGAVWTYTLRRIRLFLVLHMNLCAGLLLTTGFWLTAASPQVPSWAWWALVLVLLALVNINAHLYPALGGFAARPEDLVVQRLRRRFSLFMALHHTLITAATALMVARWP